MNWCATQSSRGRGYCTVITVIDSHRLRQEHLLYPTPAPPWAEFYCDAAVSGCMCGSVCEQNNSNCIALINIIFGRSLPSGPSMRSFKFEKKLSGVKVGVGGLQIWPSDNKWERNVQAAIKAKR